VLPRPLAVVAVAAIVVAIALPEPTDQFAWVFAGPLFAAYALQGFASLHALSRGLPMRPLLLIALYGCCAIRAQWTLPLIALVGLIDAAANLRARAAAARRSKFESCDHTGPKERTMEVILLERVGKLGHMGDTVRVKDGYARNFLLPSGKALRATEANKKKFESNAPCWKRATSR